MHLGDQNLNEEEAELKTTDIKVAEFIKHEHFSAKTKWNDIALIRIEHPILNFSKFLRPACLWSGDKDPQKVIATGWVKKFISY